MYKQSVKQPDVREYAVVDSLERQLRKLGFGPDFVWSIISHIRGNSKLEKIITYSGDQGTYDYIVNKLGILDTPGQVFYYDTEDGWLYLYGYAQPMWKKIRVCKTDKYYYLEIVE